MVNTLSHLGIGLLIASVAGLNSRQIKIVAFMAILPDLDFILNVLLLAIQGNLSHGMYNSMYLFLGHREFMHSLIFAFLVVIYVWIRENDRVLMLASAGAIFSHIYLDYATSWKMRPFFPFVMDASTIGAIDFFDPVVTVISFVPIYYILAGRAKENGGATGINGFKNGVKNGLRGGVNGIINGFTNGCNNWFRSITTGEHSRLYQHLLIVFVIWCLINPFAKAFLISGLEGEEDADISYQDSYPVSPGKFLSVYMYNDSHYKIFMSGYWSGIEKSMFVQIYPDYVDDSMPYILKAKALYDSSLPGEIDYPVYNVSSSGENVTVTISDARNPYAQYWAYFKTEYTFVFDRDGESYDVYVKRKNSHHGKTVPVNLFE